MRSRSSRPPMRAGALIGLLSLCLSSAVWAQSAPPKRTTPPRDAIAEAQKVQPVPETRPEQKKTEHDRSELFDPTKAQPSSAALAQQPDQGKMLGFDFQRDPLGAKRPMQSPQEIMQADLAAKPQVMAAQRKLLESRYDLTPRLDPEA